MLKKLKRSIKKVDLFGWHAQMYFNETNRTHKTLIGGFMSICIMSCLAAMVFFKTQTMFMKQGNQILSYTSAYDVDNNKGVNYNETKMLTYHVLRK